MTSRSIMNALSRLQRFAPIALHRLAHRLDERALHLGLQKGGFNGHNRVGRCAGLAHPVGQQLG